MARLSHGQRYLPQLDVLRTVTFAGVVAQHSILWPVTASSVVGWGFVMILHYTREAFFFLATFVAVYSQLERPRTTVGFWRRRFGGIAVTYLVWTLLYFLYTMATAPMPFGPALRTLWYFTWYGYYQLYFVVVLAQIYFVLPALLWLLRKGHHLWVLSASLLLQVAFDTLLHYNKHFGSPWVGIDHYAANTWLNSRSLLTYELFMVAGALAAVHFDRLHELAIRYRTAILRAAAVIGVATIGWYLLLVHQGDRPGHASDVFQPVVIVWFFAAVAGLYCLGCWWQERRPAEAAGKRWSVLRWGSDVSGGYYFAHVLVLESVYLGLSGIGALTHLAWGWNSAILFVLTMTGTGIIVTLLHRTPLRTVLTGPDRAAQRHEAELADGRRDDAERAGGRTRPAPVRLEGAEA